jgi:hypothetical protein
LPKASGPEKLEKKILLILLKSVNRDTEQDGQDDGRPVSQILLICPAPCSGFFSKHSCKLHFMSVVDTDTRNVEALLLKGNVLLDLKKLADAMNHFRHTI